MKKEDKDVCFKIGLGMGAIEDIAKAHKIPFSFRYSPVSGNWSITVMSTHFKGRDLRKVIADALELVVRAKDESLHKKLFSKSTP